jgi:ABC-type lipoprotein release transport system permease subunit
MRSAVLRKSLADLTRRRARAVFTVATLALAVASLGIFALPPLADSQMKREVEATRLADLTVEMRPLVLSPRELAALTRLPNVTAVEARSSFPTRVYAGERRDEALLVGVRDFSRQTVDVVTVASGQAPGPGAVLSEVQNARSGRFAGRTGDTVRALAADGSVRPLPVSGEGRNLDWGQEVIFESTTILYATPETVASLSGTPGFDSLAFRLRRTEKADVETTLAAVRRYLRAETAFTGFTNLPSVRAPGAWPGKEDLEQFSEVLYIITALALLSALVLISSTMTTLVGEQTGEIATMKAIGARRRQIALIYIRTALLLGALGTVVGTALGILLANVLVGFFGSEFFGVGFGFGVDVPVVLGSIALGLIGPPLAALPAIRRAARLSVRDALQATGSAAGGQGRIDRALRSVRFVPRTAQIGLRSAGRRKRRSLVTALQVGLAVGTLLALLGLGTGVAETVRRGWTDHGWDIWVGSGRPLDTQAEKVIRSTPGVAVAEPMMDNEIELRGHAAFTWGTHAATRLRYRIDRGRWYTAEEERRRARVTVIERNLARVTDVHVGDRVLVLTAAGPVALRVIGLSSNQQENGTVLFVPLATLRSILNARGGFSDYWVATTSRDHALIDRTTTRLEDRLRAAGYDVETEIPYVAERDEVARMRTLTTTVTVLGFLIVAIGMVGLVGAMMMSVIERTREVGILRCLGARARDVRRIFAVEGLAVALLGWVMGIPLGYALDRLLVRAIREILNVEVVFAYPPENLPLALAGTVALALLVMLPPLRRAVRLRPGDALRYA